MLTNSLQEFDMTVPKGKIPLRPSEEDAYDYISQKLGLKGLQEGKKQTREKKGESQVVPPKVKANESYPYYSFPTSDRALLMRRHPHAGGAPPFEAEARVD